MKVGAKKFDMSFEALRSPWKINLFGGISRVFGQDIPAVPEKLEKKVRVPCTWLCHI